MKNVFLAVFLLGGGTAWGNPVSLDLATVERETLAHSPRLASARETARSADEQAGAQRSRLWPVIGLEGSYRYLTEIPTFQASPMSPAIEMGANNNYSYGPSINWMAWDSGAIQNSAKALTQQASARNQEIQATEDQLLLTARWSLFQVQGTAERLRLLAEALRLAQAQWADVELRTKAGAASRQDLLQSETEVLSRRRDFREAQTAFAVTLRNLFTLVGSKETYDLSRPLPEDLAARRPKDIPAPTLTLVLSSPNVLRSTFNPAADRPFNSALPEIRSMALQAEAARSSARAARAGHWPTLQLAAKSSRDYPNGPVQEEINQNQVGAVARWPLFEGGRVRQEAQAQESLARAAEEKRRQMEEDLRRDWERARDQLAGFVEEEKINQESVEKRRRLAQLVYDTYKLGRATFLEVQAANLGLVQAQVQSVKNEVDILSQLALLASLTTEVTP
jgi:outer membrane protein TolC